MSRDEADRGRADLGAGLSDRAGGSKTDDPGRARMSRDEGDRGRAELSGGRSDRSAGSTTVARGAYDRGRVSVAGWWAAAVLVAVAATIDPWGLRPFTTARWAVLGVVVCAAAAATRWRPQSRLTLAWVALLAWLAVATVWAADPLLAVVGHPRRHLGLAGWLVCGLAFAAGTGLRPADVRRALGRAAVLAAAVTGAAAIADLAGWDPAGVTFGDRRVGGLLGQPVYLGAVAVLLAPVALGVAADPAASVWWRRAAVVSAGGCGVALLASQTRGAWLGAAVAVAVAWRVVRGWLAAHRPAAAVGAVVLAGLAVVGPLGDRGIAAFDPASGSAPGRLDEWAVAARVVADHPLTGAGPEGYRIVAPAHIDDGYSRAHGRDEVVDRAHNGALDLAVTGGLPAAALYVALLGGLLLRCGRAIRRPRDPVVAGAAAGVVAWVVQQAVSFPVAEIDPAAWLLAGTVAAATPSRPATDEAEPMSADPGRPGVSGPGPNGTTAIGLDDRSPQPATADGTGRAQGPGRSPHGTTAIGLHARSARPAATDGGGAESRPERRWPVGVGAGRVGAGVLAGVLAIGGSLALAADRDLHRAERRSAESADAAALAAADRATARRPDDVDAWYVAGRVASSRPGLLAVDAGLDRVEDGLRWSPRDPALRSLEEALLVERALRSGLPADLDAARAAAEELIEDDPAGPAHHRHLGLVLAAQGDTDRAAGELRRALALDPDDDVARQALDGLPTR